MTAEEVFGTAYATSYDLFYADKDYTAECDLVESMFARHRPLPVRTILDLGCGTGRHACLLASRGYEVVGVDRSEDMLRAARERARANSVAATFMCGDLREVSVGSSFDAVLMMFAVLGYQITDEDLMKALTNARRHLPAGGLLVFDVWYEPAVRAQAPEERWRFYSTNDGGVVRRSHGVLRTDAPVCAVDIELWSVEAGRATADYVRECHEMRFFTDSELEKRLQDAGFHVVDLSGFPEANRRPDTSTWSVLVTARSD